MGGRDILYLGYVETHLLIPEIKAFDTDVLMPVINDRQYQNWVPMQVGTLHIDRALDLATQKEFAKLSKCWQRGWLATLIANRMAYMATIDKLCFDLDQVAGQCHID